MREFEIDEGQKIQVMLAELQERYNASHQIRERSVRFTLWISGMGIGLGWILVSQGIRFPQQLAITLLIFALFFGTAYFLAGLRRGFQKNREAIVRCERALRMHEPGVYIPDQALLPKEYRQTKCRWSDHFRTLTIWILLVAGSLLILTWTGPCAMDAPSAKVNIGTYNGGNQNG
jgi:hypothetical protein